MSYYLEPHQYKKHVVYLHYSILPFWNKYTYMCIRINIRTHFIYFHGFLYVQKPVLIGVQSEANTISLKSETLPIPDETLLLHQATFWQSDEERSKRDDKEKERTLLWIQAFSRSMEAELERCASFPQYREGSPEYCGASAEIIWSMARNESVVVVGGLIKVKLLWRQKEKLTRAKNWEPLPHTGLSYKHQTKNVHMFRLKYVIDEFYINIFSVHLHPRVKV
jgi:hypothetical protein